MILSLFSSDPNKTYWGSSALPEKKSNCGQVWLPRQDVRCFPPPSQICVTYNSLNSRSATAVVDSLSHSAFSATTGTLNSPRNILLPNMFLPTGKLSLKDIHNLPSIYGQRSKRLWNFVLTAERLFLKTGHYKHRLKVNLNQEEIISS